jgi:hypothetical protein
LFDSEKWKAWEQSEVSPSGRWEMISSLREKHDLIGKSKNEIIDLLGMPKSPEDSVFKYYLGYTKCGINTGDLEISFNKHNLVSRLTIRNG